MHLLLFLLFVTFSVVSGMEKTHEQKQKPAAIKQAFANIREYYRLGQPDKAKNTIQILQKELTNPESVVWTELGEMLGLSNFDKLPNGSKHLDLLSGRAFLESGGLDMILLWGGQNFYKTDRISVRDYIGIYKTLIFN